MKSISLFLLFILFPSLAFAGEMTADEQAVWQLEENYWKYVKAVDLEGYRTLWDERFVGWPSSSPQPLGKENITDWIVAMFEENEGNYSYELKRMAVRSFGDIVVAHYLVTEFFHDEESGELLKQDGPFRITHTWKRKDDSWQIVTGMSASLGSN